MRSKLQQRFENATDKANMREQLEGGMANMKDKGMDMRGQGGENMANMREKAEEMGKAMGIGT